MHLACTHMCCTCWLLQRTHLLQLWFVVKAVFDALHHGACVMRRSTQYEVTRW